MRPGEMGFEEFVRGFEKAQRAPMPGRPGMKMPYKDLLLAAVVIRIAAGKQSTNAVILDDGLRELYNHLLDMAFPDWPFRREPDQPFRHLDGDTWDLRAREDDEKRLRTLLDAGAGWRPVMAATQSALLPESVFCDLRDSSEARSKVAKVILAKLVAADADAQGLGLVRQLLLAGGARVVPTDEEDADEPLLESVVEQHIVQNWATTPFAEQGVQLHRNTRDELVGRQFVTPNGIIDLLGWQAEGRAWWVLELKRGRAPDHVVGQIARYMGWMANNMGRPGESVRGVIIARDASRKLRDALTVVPTVDLWMFDERLRLSAA